MDLAKHFLRYLPSHGGEAPPLDRVSDGSGSEMSRLLQYLPEKRNRVYDMKKVVGVLFDKGTFLELKAGFGRPCITGLARLGGQAVGVLANNPLFGAGALDAACCEKTTSFLVLCDSFNLPIVTLVDTPGFLVGREGEKKKLTGKIINWMNALSLVTVPKLTVVIRKIYGQAYLNMGGGKYSDVFAAWPTAEISFMDPEPGIHVVFNLRKEDDPEQFEKRLADMAKNTEPWDAAGIFGLTDIIHPEETRAFLIRMLDLHRDRKRGGIGRHLLHAWPTSY